MRYANAVEILIAVKHGFDVWFITNTLSNESGFLTGDKEYVENKVLDYYDLVEWPDYLHLSPMADCVKRICVERNFLNTARGEL